MHLSFNRLRYFLCCLLCFHSSANIGQTVYTWVDDKGHRHFSDHSIHSNATAIELPNTKQSAPPPQVLPSPKTKDLTTQPPEDQDTPTPLEITIISPQHDQTLRSNAGFISIQGELSRKLRIGEQLQLMMNGNRYGAPQQQALWQLKNVDRGSHSFTIQSFRDGKLIASSSPITVHLQRAKVKTAVPPPES
jgi:hypothetical protein